MPLNLPLVLRFSIQGDLAGLFPCGSNLWWFCCCFSNLVDSQRGIFHTEAKHQKGWNVGQMLQFFPSSGRSQNLGLFLTCSVLTCEKCMASECIASPSHHLCSQGLLTWRTFPSVLRLRKDRTHHSGSPLKCQNVGYTDQSSPSFLGEKAGAGGFLLIVWGYRRGQIIMIWYHALFYWL